VQTVARKHKVGTVPVKVLDGVSGVLRPGRLTLLMGPPGAGKSVFMKALGGRLRPGPDLRELGTVRYNGLSTKEFCVERAIGLVDQYDDRELQTSASARDTAAIRLHTSSMP
jgi:ABC-type multidrug transport system ATPase subunit